MMVEKHSQLRQNAPFPISTDDKDFTHFEPQYPQYKNLKNGEFTSLNLRIMDQNNSVITDGPQVTLVLHIRDRKI